MARFTREMFPGYEIRAHHKRRPPSQLDGTEYARLLRSVPTPLAELS